MKSYPLWIFGSLGKMVGVILPSTGKAARVKLQGIDCGDGGDPYAIVQVSATDPGDLENFSFDDLVALAPVRMTLDADHGFMYLE